MTSLLEVKDLVVHFPIRSGLMGRPKYYVHALNGVSFSLFSGETLGVVGESGCGKSTLGRALLRLYQPTSGGVHFDGKDILSLGRSEMKDQRRDMQMIFQDPYESLNTRHTVRQILQEPYEIHKLGSREERIKWSEELIQRVGLPVSALNKYPHEFSGGQRQRIGIARAIALNPKLIVCDEPVSALDVSIQSQVLNLLLELQKELKMSYIFIAHDLAVVKHVSDRVAVMYLGEIVELTDAETIYKDPQHPYTRALLSAIPVPDPTAKKDRIVLEGDVPSPITPPSGCTFHTRCPYAKEICKKTPPELKSCKENKRLVSCHFAGEI